MHETVAVYPGTFDPATLGHLDVVERALNLFDRVIVAVTTNPNKNPLFSLPERVELLKQCTKGLPNVEVEDFNCLLVDYVKRRKARIVIKGLRALSDFESEFQQAITNRKLAPDIETVFIVTNPKYFYLNSSVVKEIASGKGKLQCFVPKPVEAALRKKFPGKGENI